MAAVYVLVCRRTTASLIKHTEKSHLSHPSIISSGLMIENLLFLKIFHPYMPAVKARMAQ